MWSGVRFRNRRVLYVLLSGVAVLAVLRAPHSDTHVLTLHLDIPPQTLAHYLADFSIERVLDPTISKWQVLEERSNHSSWQYWVRYHCGARCSGGAHVLSRVDLPPHVLSRVDLPPHAPPANVARTLHTLHTTHTRCWTLALLPISHCMEMEWKSAVSGGKTNSVYQERSAVRCSLLQRAILGGACGVGAGDLAAARAARLSRLQGLLRARRHIADHSYQ